MATKPEAEVLTIDGHEVSISNPNKVLFPKAGHTKGDLVRYYLAVADGALRGAGGRPNVLVRYPNGIEGEFFYQKRAPSSRPVWLDAVTLSFPSGRTAEEIVPRGPAALAWMANLACLELHPHPVRAGDLDHPDELRIDLDPIPGVEWAQVRQVAAVVHEALADFGLVGWPKTSGSRGMHVYVRIEPRWTFTRVTPRRARVRPRRGAPCADARHQQVVERGTPRRLPGLQPEREGPYGGRRLLGAATARRPRIGAARLGRGRERRSGGLHACDHAGAVCRGRRPSRTNRPAPVFTRCPPRALRSPRTRGNQRRTVAAALRETGGGAATRFPVASEGCRRPTQQAAASPSGRSSRSAVRRPRRPRSPGWSVGRSAIRRRLVTSRPRTCSSTPCAADSPRGRASA